MGMGALSRRRTAASITAGVAAVLLVIGFEAPTWASKPVAKKKIGTSQIKDHAVTTPKLANGAVTSRKVRNGSLTASDVAPNTFLASGGTAANSDQLGGKPASGYIQGTGGVTFNQVSGSTTATPQILGFAFGKITGGCSSSHPVFNFVDAESPVNVVTTTVTFSNTGATTAMQVSNGLAAGDELAGVNSSTAPQTATFQMRYIDSSDIPHVVTAWLSGEDIGGSCLFLGQALSSN
jgi:hypothetical protein